MDFYLDKKAVKAALNERRILDNFKWSMWLPWMIGLYNTNKAKYAYAPRREENRYLIESETNVFKILVSPLKAIGIGLLWLFWNSIYSIIFPFYFISCVKIRRKRNVNN